MKKLALVTLLAVAASWLLSEDGPPPSRPVPPGHPSPIHFTSQEAPRPTMPPEPPTPPRHGRGSRADRSRLKAKRVVVVAAPAAPTTPPAWFPRSEIDEEAGDRPDASGNRVLVGRVSVSEERARQDLRKILEREVAEWIAADVPPTWKVPGPTIDRMVRGSYVQKVTRNLRPSAVEVLPRPDAEAEEAPDLDVPELDTLYTLYRAGQQVDFSPERKARIIQAYRKDLATQRMQRMGGGLVLALGLLAVMSGYIRADEATRGYYTNRLRLATVAGLGVAGVAAYRLLS